ncbi:hypothetical protein Trco_004795 [Trichoderma cornu-damae]|uniref:Uncharacterized protein n=1 Tax=Trichoderma cornu-damae TaxID=654480 RepID=A0A9P8QNA5_9HYPO|nr:hypothetical protein Trco_004795 [Trichoderma cornu-damae]
MSQDAPNEVPREYLMASPSASSLLAGQSFPFPPRQRVSGPPAGLPRPLALFTHPQEHRKTRFREHLSGQASRADGDLPSSSPNLPEPGRHASSALLVHQQRLSTCLDILHHVRRTLQKRHHEAELRLARTSHLVAQTTWELFFQSPLHFMCHEMDVLADSATGAILSEGGYVLRGHSAHDGEAWMRKLEGLRELRDDELDAKERAKKSLRQVRCANALLTVGLKEQAAALQRDDPAVDPSRSAENRHHRRREAEAEIEVEAMASSSDRWVDMDGADMARLSRSTASATSSAFLNWPLPATPPNEDGDADIDSDDSINEDDRIEGRCGRECCRRFAE